MSPKKSGRNKRESLFRRMGRALAGMRTGLRETLGRQTDDVWGLLLMVLAILVTAGFFGIVLYILRFGLPESGKEALLLLLGSLGAAWTSVMAFYFGSSSGSQKKTEALTAAIGNGK